MVHTVRSMVLDLSGRAKPTLHGRVAEVEEESGSQQTPEEKVTVKTG